ncbi:uncharacterized protein LOC129598440 [Paramacrobiotus metropolitanus]|uniref:uncharacterized protein LOC129598440 n=1 Tax=Paramacrobiotus metropolitanus TaxID=2943436 RepID=UPI002445718B|nr:uncharacterized protein LOC129598440 [Paramacrobiotus metropolitanus]
MVEPVEEDGELMTDPQLPVDAEIALAIVSAVLSSSTTSSDDDGEGSGNLHTLEMAQPTAANEAAHNDGGSKVAWPVTPLSVMEINHAGGSKRNHSELGHHQCYGVYDFEA